MTLFWLTAAFFVLVTSAGFRLLFWLDARREGSR